VVRPALLVSVIAAVALGGASTPPAEHIREQRTVTVGGVKEVWRLVWTGKPSLMCSPHEAEMAITCPCSGWAYGEAGDLSLVRLRDGKPVDRMRLGPLYGKYDYPAGEVAPGQAYLQRWAVRDGDWDRRQDSTLAAEIMRRRPTTIMQLADYDHDGRATEFLIQVGTLPCGKRQFAAVGVSAKAERLHALGSPAHAGKALVMPLRAWQALLKTARPKPLIIWECDDHGSEVRSVLEVSAQGGVIRAVDRDYGCQSAGTAGRLMKVTAW
jgi:hypothetical protein